MSSVRILDDSKNIVGESPLWHPEHGSVYWTDVNGFKIQRYVLQSRQKTSWDFGEPVCALSLTTDPECLLVALGSGLILWRPSTGQRSDFAHPETDRPSKPLKARSPAPHGVFLVRSMRHY